MTWIKLYRNILDWEWYSDSKMVHLFIHLLLKANHQDGQWRGVDIKRGQLLTGKDSLYQQTKISPQSLRTCLTKLKSTGDITIKSTNKYSIITLCNYELYQTKQQADNKQPNKRATNEQQTINRLPNTKQEYNNTNNDLELKELKNNSEPSSGIYQSLNKIYFDWHKNRMGVNPQFDGSDGTALKQLIKYFETLEAGDENVIKNFTALLSNFDSWDKFHQGQTRLRQINSNLTNIINKLKNGKQTNGVTKDGIIEAYKKRVTANNVSNSTGG